MEKVCKEPRQRPILLHGRVFAAGTTRSWPGRMRWAPIKAGIDAETGPHAAQNARTHPVW